MKTKIKIIISTIFIVIILVASLLTALSLNDIKYNMQFNKPSRIVVYYNTETGNQVFEPSDSQYNIIYTNILNGCKQPILTAFTKGQLNKDIKIEKVDSATISFNGVTINFVYDSPQALKGKSKLYNYNNSTYWYQNLIFNISGNNQFGYNNIAIIPPIDASYYEGQYTYNLQYQVYSNFNTVYNYAISLFN